MDDLARITNGFRAATEGAPALDGAIQIDLGAAGLIHIAKGSVTNDDLPADCVMRMSVADFDSIAREELDPLSAFMTGRVKISGQLKLAVELGRRLAGSRSRGVI